MKKTYELTCNIHIPEMKTTVNKGARIIIEDDSFTIGDVTIPIPQSFSLLLRHDLIKELSEEETKKPEKIETTPAVRQPDREKMQVVQAEENEIPLMSAAKLKKEDEQISEVKVVTPEEPVIRGMKVIEEDSIKIEKSIEKAKNDTDDMIKRAQGDSPKAKSTAAKTKARPTPKPRKSTKSNAEKAKDAERVKAERIKSVDASKEEPESEDQERKIAADQLKAERIKSTGVKEEK